MAFLWLLFFLLLDAVAVAWYVLLRTQTKLPPVLRSWLAAVAFLFLGLTVLVLGVGHIFGLDNLEENRFGTIVSALGSAGTMVVCGPFLCLPLLGVIARSLSRSICGLDEDTTMPSECALAQALERQGYHDRADAAYREALKGVSTDAQVLLLYAAFLRRRARYADAVREWERALEHGLPAEDALLAATRAAECCQQHLQDLPRAVGILDLVLEKHPHGADAAAVGRRLALMQKKLDERRPG